MKFCKKIVVDALSSQSSTTTFRRTTFFTSITNNDELIVMIIYVTNCHRQKVLVNENSNMLFSNWCSHCYTHNKNTL